MKVSRICTQCGAEFIVYSYARYCRCEVCRAINREVNP